MFFFFSSRRRHTRFDCDWSSDVCSSDLYNYSFARLIFVSGLDRRLPKAMSHVNKAKVPDTAVWVQTVIAALFTLVAFVIVPSVVGGKSSVNVQTEIYDVLQAAVTVIWCISIVVLF